MTVASTTNRKSFSGDGVTTSFGTSPVVFYESTDLVVEVFSSAGVATTLTEGTQYTVSGGSSTGATGTVNLAGGTAPYGAPAVGTTLLIRRVLPLVQEADFVNNDINDAEVSETALDKLTMIAQQQDEDLGRAIKVAAAEGEQDPIVVTGKAGYYLRRNIAGTAFELAVGGANTSAFTQSGTGAVERSVTSKLGETVSVKDFGAVGDGVTDDSTAFENAVATGKRVYVPEGTYLVNVLDLPSNTYIFGDGESTIIKPYDTTQRGALGCNSGDAAAFITGLVFKDFKLLGPVATLGFSEQRHLMDLHGVKRCRIENVFFEGMQGDGLYVGAGLTGQERHNHDVSVLNCVFDGLINDNRQGCSVIDVNGMVIDGCLFQNCARSNMPGSLDFEPDSSDEVIKNVRVTNNKFVNTDGNRGHVCIQTQNTLNVENIVVSGNHFEDVPSGSAGVSMSFSDTTPTGPQRIVIEGNTFDLTGSRGIYKLDGVVNGLVIANNIINAITGTWLTYTGAENSNENIIIEGNQFLGQTGASSLLLNDSFADVSIRGNLFKGSVTRHIFLVGTTYSGISITDNDFSGAASSAVIAQTVTTINAVTNVLLNNRFENNAAVQFAAARSDYAGNVANPTGADEASAPSVFNPGISRVRISSRTIAGATQNGILETYALVGTGYTAHFQLFYPDYSASYADKIYFRKAVNSSTWDSWYLIGGALTGSATYDPPNLVDGDGATTTVTVTGAALGDFAEASFSLDLQGITVTAWVSAANTVSVRFQNESGGTLDLSSGTLRARVRKL